MNIVNQNAILEFITPNALELIELIGRTCYKSEDKITSTSARAFIQMIIHKGHETILEHAHATFRVICDRGVSHEFVRHRIFSYAQESTRYCNYSKMKFGNEITIIQPPFIKPESQAVWLNANSCSERAYFELLSLGEPPELARSVLMTDLKTELIGTANFREWRYFVKLRTDKKAHPQMQEVANLIYDALFAQYPDIFSNL